MSFWSKLKKALVGEKKPSKPKPKPKKQTGTQAHRGGGSQSSGGSKSTGTSNHRGGSNASSNQRSSGSTPQRSSGSGSTGSSTPRTSGARTGAIGAASRGSVSNAPKTGAVSPARTGSQRFNGSGSRSGAIGGGTAGHRSGAISTKKGDERREGEKRAKRAQEVVTDITKYAGKDMVATGANFYVNSGKNTPDKVDYKKSGDSLTAAANAKKTGKYTPTASRPSGSRINPRTGLPETRHDVGAKARDFATKVTESAERDVQDATKNISDKKKYNMPRLGSEKINSLIGMPSTKGQYEEAKSGVDKNIKKAHEQVRQSIKELKDYGDSQGWTDDTKLSNGMTWGETKKKASKRAVRELAKMRADAYKNIEDVGKISARDIAQTGIKGGVSMAEILGPYMLTAGKALKAVDALSTGSKALTTAEGSARVLSQAGKNAAKNAAKSIADGEDIAKTVSAVQKRVTRSNLKNNIKREVLANALQDATIGTAYDYAMTQKQGLSGKEAWKEMGKSAALNAAMGGPISAVAGRTGRAGKTALKNELKGAINEEFARINKMTDLEGRELLNLTYKERGAGLTSVEKARMENLQNKAVTNKAGVVQMDSNGRLVANDGKSVKEVLTQADIKEFARVQAKQATGTLTKEDVKTLASLSKKVEDSYAAVAGNAEMVLKYGPKKGVDIDRRDLESAVNYFAKTGDQKKLRKAQEILDADIKKATERNAALEKGLNAMTEKTGIKYQFVGNDEMLQAFGRNSADNFFIKGAATADKDGNPIVLINRDAPQAHQTIIGHETGHLIKDSDTEGFKKLGEMLREHAEERGELEDFLKEMKSNYPDLKNKKEAFDEEVTCELLGRYIFGEDDKFIKRLAGEHPSAFERIIDYIRNLARRITDPELAKQLDDISKKAEELTGYIDKDKVKAEMDKSRNAKKSQTLDELIADSLLEDTSDELRRNRERARKLSDDFDYGTATREDLNAFKERLEDIDYEMWENVTEGKPISDETKMFLLEKAENINKGINPHDDAITVRKITYDDGMDYDEWQKAYDAAEKADEKIAGENPGLGDVDAYVAWLNRVPRTNRNKVQAKRHTEYESPRSVDNLTDEEANFLLDDVKKAIDEKEDELIEAELEKAKNKEYDDSLNTYTVKTSDYDIDVPDKAARYTEERIDRLIKQFGYGHGSRASDSKAFVALINPKDYVDLTLSRAERPKWFDKEVAGYDYMNELKTNTQTPYLIVDIDSGRVLGHEGRHRLDILSKNGIESVPVVIEAVDKNVHGRIVSSPMKKLELTGQSFNGKAVNGARVEINDLVPIATKNRDELIEKFGGDASVRFSKSKTSEQIKKMDDDYIKAVDSGDTETAERMVREYAKEQFPNTAVKDADGELIPMYHTTTSGRFNEFDKSRLSPEGDSGAGIYLTNTKDDSVRNYGSAEGPDVKNKIERLAEQLYEYGDFEEYDDALEAARNEVVKEPAEYDTFVNVEKPVYVGRGKNGEPETNLMDDIMDDFESEIERGDYDTEDEFEDALMYEREEYLADKIDEIAYAVEDIGYDADGIRKAVREAFQEGMDYDRLTFDDLKKSLNEHYLENEDGQMISNEVARAITEELGYDGIIDYNVPNKFRNMDGVNEDTFHTIVFDSNQVKSLEPVTYDDAGKVIPLSERFNTESPDMRFSKSIADTDTRGNKLTKEQQDFFADTTLKQKNGKLKVLYHGSPNTFNVFKAGDIGFHLGTKSQARTRVGAKGNVVEYYGNLRNPIKFDVDLGSWDADYVLTNRLVEKGVISDEEARGVLRTDDGKKRSTGDANKRLRELLRDKGYDGISYKNSFEGSGNSYILFDPNQAKRIDNYNPTDSPDVRFSKQKAMPEVKQPATKEVTKTKKQIKAERKAAERQEAIGRGIDVDAYEDAKVSYRNPESLSDSDIEKEMNNIYWANKNAKTEAHTKIRNERKQALEDEIQRRKEDRPAYAALSEEQLADNDPGRSIMPDDEVNAVEIRDEAAPSVRVNKTAIENIAKEAPRSKQPAWMQSFRRLMVNSLTGFEDVAKKSKNAKLLTQVNNVQHWRNKFAAWIEGERAGMDRKVSGDGLNTIFDNAKLFGKKNIERRNDFVNYLTYKHAIDRLKYDKPVHMDPATGGSLYSAREYQDMMDAIRTKYEAKGELKLLDEFEKGIRGYYDDVMKMRVDSGLISKEFADELTKKYPNYIPTLRDGDEWLENGAQEGARQKFAIPEPIKKAVGGSQDILDLYQSTMRVTKDVIRDAEQNKLMRQYARSMGVDPNAVTKEQLGELPSFAANATKTDKGWRVSFFQDGRMVTMNVDKQIARGLREFNGKEYERLMKLAGAFSGPGRWFKAAITDYNIIFGVRNGARDIQQAAVNSKSLRDFTAAIPTAQASVLRKNMPGGTADPWMKSYEANGGMYSTFVQQGKGFAEPKSKGAVKTGVDATAGKVLRGLETVNSAIEATPRMAEYIGTIKKDVGAQLAKEGSSLAKLKTSILEDMYPGKIMQDLSTKQYEALEDAFAKRVLEMASTETIDKAARNAADITLNFSRNGVIGKALNTGLVPYFNPAVQGLSKTIRMFTENGAEGMKSLMNFGIKLGTMTIAPAVANEILCRDNRDYQNLATREKDTNFFIPIGDGKFIKVPKPRENAVLAEPVTYGLRYFFDKARIGAIEEGEYSQWKDLGQAFVSGWDNIGPVNPFSDNLLSPIVRLAQNKTWYGGSIESVGEVLDKKEGRLENKDIYDDTTSALAIQIGQTKAAQALHLSPKKVDDLMDSYLGVIYDLGISQTAETTHGNPILNQFVKDSVFSNKTGTELWSEFEHANSPKDIKGKVKQKAKDIALGHSALNINEKTQEAKDWLNQKGYDDMTYSTAVTNIRQDDSYTEKQKENIIRQWKRDQADLRRELVYGSGEVSWKKDPLRAISEVVGMDKAMKDYTYTYEDPDTGEKRNQHLDAWKAFKKSDTYKKDKEKGGERFLDFYTKMRWTNGKIGEGKSYPKRMTASVLAATEKGNNDDLAKAYIRPTKWEDGKDTGNVNEERQADIIQRGKNYRDAGFTQSDYRQSQKTIFKASRKLGNDYTSEMQPWDSAMALATSGKNYKDGAYYSADENGKVSHRMNYARCLNEKGYSTKQINKFAKDYDLDVETYGWTSDQWKAYDDKVANAVRDKYGNKPLEEQAAIYHIITDDSWHHPFGEVGDYSLKGDTGITDLDARDTSGWGHGGYGRRRRGYRRRGWGGYGGGSGGGGGTMPTTASGAIKGKVTDPFGKVSKFGAKSNLDDAYRKKARKLAEANRKKLS